MYLLFLDESGTHGASPVFVLAGVAVHENDVWRLGQKIETGLHKVLTPLGMNAFDFELHGSEMKSPPTRRNSPWKALIYTDRLKALDVAYRSIRTFVPTDPAFPMAFFGAVIERRRPDFAEHAYELILNKFDDMLGDVSRTSGNQQRGVVVHDDGVIEHSVQSWTSQWMQAAGRVGQIHNIVVVPLFANSRATRLLQAADLVCYSLWRYYANTDERYVRELWKLFHSDGTQMHGLIHVCADFARRTCTCPPCVTRLSA